MSFNENKLSEVLIYTDGACSGNPGIGGYAAILKFNNISKEIFGYEELTTNNRMELRAVIEALACLSRPCSIKLYSDSAYFINAYQQDWLKKWKVNGWKNSAKQDVSNKDLWLALDDLASKHEIEFIKVKGHSDNELNNRCDKLAVAAYKEKKVIIKHI